MTTEAKMRMRHPLHYTPAQETATDTGAGDAGGGQPEVNAGATNGAAPEVQPPATTTSPPVVQPPVEDPPVVTTPLFNVGDAGDPPVEPDPSAQVAAVRAELERQMESERAEYSRKLEELRARDEDKAKQLEALEALRVQNEVDSILANMPEEFDTMDPAQIQELKRKWLAPMLAEVRAQQSKATAEVNKLLNKANSDMEKSVVDQREQAARQHYASINQEIMRSVPDAEKILGSKEFRAYSASPIAPGASLSIHKVLSDEYAKGNATYVVETLKAFLGQNKARIEAYNAGAEAPATRGGGTGGAKPDSGNFNYEDELSKLNARRNRMTPTEYVKASQDLRKRAGIA